MMKDIRRYIRKNRLNIYNIAIWRDGELSEAKCCMSNDVNNSYSITKLYINTLIGMMIDEGVLHLDDRLTEILRPAMPYSYDPAWDEVTIKHALKHRMGIDRGVLDADRDRTSDYPTEDYLKLILDVPPVFEAGSRRVYTDVPHYMLSRLITFATGFPADEVIKERILRPMSCDQTAWFRCPRNYTIGGTGAFMRASDLVKLGVMYMNGGVYDGKRIVSEDWVRLSEQEHFDIYNVGAGFLGKAGQNGQMLMYSREKNLAAAWQGFMHDGEDKGLIELLAALN